MANWIPPQLADANAQSRSLSWEEWRIFYTGYKPWGVWDNEKDAWRGHIARKLLGRKPKPDEVDMPAGSCYWEPDQIFFSDVRNAQGEVIRTLYRRHGCELKETHPAVQRIKERRSRS